MQEVNSEKTLKYLHNHANIKTRSNVLYMCLVIEQDISEIILLYLNIDKENRKAITHKSSNLSFRSRIDLLFDLNIIDQTQHEYFLLLMEYRNQFMHNLDCDSFVKAVTLLGKDKGKRLLVHYPYGENDNCEVLLADSYEQLFLKCIFIVNELKEQRESILKENFDKLKSMQEFTELLFSSYCRFVDDLMGHLVDINGNSKELIQFKSKLLDFIDKVDDSNFVKINGHKFAKEFDDNFLKVLSRLINGIK